MRLAAFRRSDLSGERLERYAVEDEGCIFAGTVIKGHGIEAHVSPHHAVCIIGRVTVSCACGTLHSLNDWAVIVH